MLDYFEITTLEEQVATIQAGLAGVVEPAPEGPLKTVLDYEPNLWGDDAYTALAVQNTGFEHTGRGTAEIELPDLVSFAARAYYPVLDGTDEDGLRVAQRETLAGISAFDAGLRADPTLGGTVLFAKVVAGRIVGIPQAISLSDATTSSILLAYEVDVRAKAH